MDKKNIALGVALVALIIAIGLIFTGKTKVNLGSSPHGTTNYDSLSLDSNLTVTGTSTVANSTNGKSVGGKFTISTTSATTLYANTGKTPLLCNASAGALYVKNNGSFAPSLVFSVGTSTGSLPTTNLIASSTIATTTTTVVSSVASSFVLGATESIMGMIGDITNTSASSTYWGNWTAEFDVQCRSLSI